MTRDQIRTYVTELATMVKQARTLAKAKAEITARIAMSERTGDADGVRELTKEKTNVTALLDAVEQLAAEKANREDITGAERLVLEISTRIEAYEEYRTVEERNRGTVELSAALGEFEGETVGVTRADAEAHVADDKARADKQLEIAAQYVPNKAVLITSGAPVSSGSRILSVVR